MSIPAEVKCIHRKQRQLLIAGNVLLLTLYGNSATSNNMKLVHWPLIGGLLRLVQRGRTPPHCSKHNSRPINGQCTNHLRDTLLQC